MDAHILIVDDSPDLVQVLSDILVQQGYRVESRDGGKSGWGRLMAAVEHQAPMPDLLLLDLMMPDIDGLTLLRRIRADERLALLPVVILTAQADSDTRLMALEAGANDYLPKPVQTIELLARVKALLGWKLAERLQQHRMERLVEAGRQLLYTVDLDTALERVMQIAMNGMDAEGASVWLQGPDGNLRCRAASGPAVEHLKGKHVAPGQDIVGRVLQQKQAVLMPDPHAAPRFIGQPNAMTSIRDRVAAPLLVRGSGIGVLEVVNKKGESFSPMDLAWLEVLAPLAAAAIANAQLFHALQQRTAQLQARNEELDAFAHTVAHDLKNPLSSIIGFAEALDKYYNRMPAEELRGHLHRIAQNGRKMSRIIDELLLLAGVRKMEVKVEALDMASIIGEAIQRLADMIEEHHAEIRLPDTWPAARGYAPWVEEVWVNYLSNAIKYGGRPPRIEIGAAQQPDGMVRFWVRDNGPGLTPEAQARLFTPFTRLSEVRAEGHGLGLSIVRRIVTRLGGQVGVQSELGRGSTFTFTLKAAPGSG